MLNLFINESGKYFNLYNPQGVASDASLDQSEADIQWVHLPPPSPHRKINNLFHVIIIVVKNTQWEYIFFLETVVMKI